MPPLAPLSPETVVMDPSEPDLHLDLTHGGGATMICQTRDTNVHAQVRERFIELYGNGEGPMAVDSTVDRAPSVGRTAAEKKERYIHMQGNSSARNWAACTQNMNNVSWQT